MDKIVTFCVGMGIGEAHISCHLPLMHAPRRHLHEAHDRGKTPAAFSAATVLELAFCAAFWKGWDMTLVILAAMPVLIIVGAAIGTVTASLGKVAAGVRLGSSPAGSQNRAEHAVTPCAWS